MHRRDISITLGGQKLDLKFEAENLFELTAITGEPYFEFVRRCVPKKGETTTDAGVRCADLTYLVPLIMAGLAHHDEYSGLTHRQLRRKICRQIDMEAEQSKTPVIVVTTNLVAEIIPVVARTLVPPGVDLDAKVAEMDDADKQRQEVPKHPLAEYRVAEYRAPVPSGMEETSTQAAPSS